MYESPLVNSFTTVLMVLLNYDVPRPFPSGMKAGLETRLRLEPPILFL